MLSCERDEPVLVPLTRTDELKDLFDAAVNVIQSRPSHARVHESVDEQASGPWAVNNWIH